MTNFSIVREAEVGASSGPGRVAKPIYRGISRTAGVTLPGVPAPTRDEAWELFCEWTESDSLRKHVLGVEAGMRAYARRYGEDEELWAVTGILHDLDYERFPDLETGHPRVALELFEEKGYPQELIDAVAGHADRLGVPRESRMAKALYAVDELSGFIAACALVRPTGIEGMTPKSVKKKLKAPSFAAAVDRDEVRSGAEDLGEDFDEHLRIVIAAMEERSADLGLGPREA
jgi:putative nucleotidyltransferase with HDIG domain